MARGAWLPLVAVAVGVADEKLFPILTELRLARRIREGALGHFQGRVYQCVLSPLTDG